MIHSKVMIIPRKLEDILEQLSGVFATPSGLPPVRGYQLQIVLKQGTQPISVRPFRYPQAHKETMILVSQMLDSGIIRPSHSPFSSHVLW